MELLSVKKPSNDVNGKEAHSVDDLLQQNPVPTKTKGWGTKRKKSASLDTDVFIGEGMCTLLRVYVPLKYLILIQIDYIFLLMVKLSVMFIFHNTNRSY